MTQQLIAVLFASFDTRRDAALLRMTSISAVLMTQRKSIAVLFASFDTRRYAALLRMTTGESARCF